MDYEIGRAPGAPSTDADGATATAQAAAIHAQPKGATTIVGNYRMFPGNGDTSGVGAGPSTATYAASGMNMANEDLYPGQATYKNPGSLGGTSTSPNIRSSLFVLPIDRATFVTANLANFPGHQHIPYVNRFNNSGNPALDSDGNPSNGYVFTNSTGNQMLSRGDFAAMVAHYRARGVNGLHLLDGGVQGYSQSDFESDAKKGFTFAPFANIFAGSNPKLATLDTTSKVNGVIASNESTGVVFSGVYSLTQTEARPIIGGGTTTGGKLALLVSNLSGSSATLEFTSKIGGKTVVGAPYSVGAGEHRLLEFAGLGLQWQLVSNSIPTEFMDADRSGVGVPEPVAMGGAGIFALTMLFRRRRSR
jgi:hypothetical protein